MWMKTRKTLPPPELKAFTYSYQRRGDVAMELGTRKPGSKAREGLNGANLREKDAFQSGTKL